MASTRKLRILCIHGYRQNAHTFKDKTGAFRKLLKNHAEIVYITAPHKVPPGNLGSAAWTGQPVSDNPPDEKAEERGWWFSREDDYFKSTEYSDVSKGFQTSVDQIVEFLEDSKDGNFDGILGFSQGACLVSMLCRMQQNGQKNWFKFAVLIAGFKSRSSNHEIYYPKDVCIPIPTLHVYGDGDQIVSAEMSEELLQYFEDPKCLTHPGGHFVPASGSQKKTYLEFFTEMVDVCGISSAVKS
ncbi:unnamed protein product [Lymnaea stagnalis]|uniref:Serine hydrolase domain-containing protein n=1 Tax=Lymnaea stagnalis TaxID=6523 RepID=A0AAV2H477_LYMST